MSRDIWDPNVYTRYADERSRPFFELVGRVAAENPGEVVDLGCGTGELTATLAERWPEARIRGVDSSAAMIAKAPAGDRLSFAVQDARDWRGEPDVIVSNALLQWVPEHRDLLEHWVSWLPADGWLAFQVPGNFDAPSHRIIRELCRTRWKEELADTVRDAPVGDPIDYHGRLTALGCAVDAWETTYVHLLPGSVLEWVKGTALRPMLDRLTPEQQAEFLADCGRMLDEAYPARPYGTPFPFRRVFVVARKVGRKIK
ncbi:trans-aconitate 2-methyltransferase [Streptosporangiaceae bacterium NEAU-GS5]|nr:trans-aconitate 2-methyltransferase [Streptosporangiaceae bacterium NEAU-GS5]